MFDASEVLFLNHAVKLNFLTPNQRERLLAWQEDLDPDSGVTAVVQEYALMDESEVQQTLQAIESGVSEVDTEKRTAKVVTKGLLTGGRIERVPDNPGDRPKPMTATQLDDLLEDSGADENDEIARALAQGIRGMLHDGKAPPAQSYAEEEEAQSGDGEYEYEYEEGYEYEDDSEQPQPAFPMPGEGSGEAAYEYAESESSDEVYEYEYEDGEEGAYEEEYESAATQMAASPDEINGLLVEEEATNADFKGGVDISARTI